MNRCNAGRLNLGSELGFPSKAFDKARIARDQIGTQDLERNRSLIHRQLPRAIDDTHGATANHLFDAIVPQLRARFQRGLVMVVFTARLDLGVILLKIGEAGFDRGGMDGEALVQLRDVDLTDFVAHFECGLDDREFVGDKIRRARHVRCDLVV